MVDLARRWQSCAGSPPNARPLYSVVTSTFDPESALGAPSHLPLAASEAAEKIGPSPARWAIRADPDAGVMSLRRDFRAVTVVDAARS